MEKQRLILAGRPDGLTGEALRVLADFGWEVDEQADLDQALAAARSGYPALMIITGDQAETIKIQDQPGVGLVLALPGGRAVEQELIASLKPLAVIFLPARDEELRAVLETASIRLREAQQSELRAAERTAALRAANEELKDQRARLQTLGAELILAEERERRRLSNDLYSHIGQNLILTQIRLKSLRAVLSDRDHVAAAEELINLVADLISSTRSLAMELSPPILYDIGLEAAVDWLVEHFQTDQGFRIDFAHDPAPNTLPLNLRILLFRAVRELLLNVIKHAGVGWAKVTIRRRPGEIEIKVSDDGVGFDPAAAEVSGQVEGVGLFGLKERIKALKGALEILSRPGEGTVIWLSVPLQEEG